MTVSIIATVKLLKHLQKRVDFLEKHLGLDEGLTEAKVKCPHCGSKPGTFCRTPSGRKTYWHKARQTLVKEQPWVPWIL